MASKRRGAGRPDGPPSAEGLQRRRGPATMAAALVLALSLAGTAVASSGGISVGEGGGKSDLRLRKVDVAPGTVYFAGKRQAEFSFELKGAEPADVEVRLYEVASGTPIRSWRFDALKPAKPQSLIWKGKRASGELAANGEHEFRVFDSEGGAVETSSGKRGTKFGYFRHKFPLRGPHTYGDGLGAGRGHRGQDLFANCGRRVVAARAGRVQWRRSEGRAGHFVVIDGKGTDQDYVYMHLKKKGRPPEGRRVKTGQRIGFNGRSGNASGCHVHFELWSGPGWFEGGKWMNATKHLRRWDAWS